MSLTDWLGWLVGARIEMLPYPGPFQGAKLWIVENLDLAKDALHIYIGLTAFLLMAMVLKRGARDGRAWLVVLLLALAGEAWDIYESLVYGRSRGLEWGASAHDLWNTLFWPTVILLIARHTRLFRKG